ncbi:MAG: hypothetical protein AAB393_03140, partial [Bacteroidota bacterium]
MLDPNNKGALNPKAAWAVIAGVAVLVVAVSYLLIRNSARPSADGAGQSGQPSIVLSPRNGATLRSEKARFRWTRIANASAYT